MTDPELTVSYSDFTLADVHALTAPTAKYANKPDPQVILRKGLIEEVAEYAWEVAQGRKADEDQFESELGDVLWYVSEISQFQKTTIAGLAIGQSFDDFQAQVDVSNVLPILGTDGVEVDAEEQPHIALAVMALRVVDVLNPKNKDLWFPSYQRPSPEKSLGDLLTITSFIASRHSILLSGALKHTIEKLSDRERKPHVIDEANKNELVASMRERLNIHPFVGTLLVTTFAAEASEETK